MFGFRVGCEVGRIHEDRIYYLSVWQKSFLDEMMMWSGITKIMNKEVNGG